MLKSNMQNQARVNKEEMYWFVDELGNIDSAYEDERIIDDLRYESGNYFHSYVEAVPLSKKIEAVLKGADVIEMPSKEEMLNSLPSDWSFEQYMSGVGIGWHKCYDWLKSKIVK